MQEPQKLHAKSPTVQADELSQQHYLGAGRRVLLSLQLYFVLKNEGLI